jgi:hypothetical protein
VFENRVIVILLCGLCNRFDPVPGNPTAGRGVLKLLARDNFRWLTIQPVSEIAVLIEACPVGGTSYALPTKS